MKKTKKALILLLVSLLAFNTFLISASAYTEPTSLLGVDVNLEVGRYVLGEFVPLTPGEALFTDDIITVRILPTTDFLAGATRYVVMFTKSHLQVVNANKAAFTPNYDNEFYATVCSDYAGATNIPESAWPAALKSVGAGGNGTFTTDTAVAVNNTSASSAPNGGYPGHVPGEWLFRFDLRVTQNITIGSGVKVWMASQWLRKPGYTSGQMYFTKCLDSTKLSTAGSSTLYNFNLNLDDANISLEPSADATITFDANGGTGGTGPTVMQIGDPLTAPTVTRPGYAFAGWNPAVPATVQGDATYTAQWVITTVNVTQVDENTLAVNIQGWADAYGYQIWTYQKVTSDLFLNTTNGVTANQWILSQAYTLGSAGAVQPDGSINFNIDNFVSPNDNYTIAVRIVDEDGNYINEMRNAYTAETLLTAQITKVLVDGVYSRGSSQEDIDNNVRFTEVKEIGAGATTLIKVIGNLTGMTYTATVVETSQVLLPSNGNEFVWDISGLLPRGYTVRVTASNGVTTDTQDIEFLLFASSGTTQYGMMNGLNITGGTLPTVPQNIQITPSFANGNFYYVIREPGRSAIFTSGQYSAAAAIEHGINKFGTYYLYGYANRASISPSEANFDDRVIKTIEIKRSQVLPSTATLTATVNSAPANLANPIAKGATILFEASAEIGGIGTTPVQYSFWRYDAKGYSLVKDWSSENTLTWTPGRVGSYTIQVRAKGEDAGSYEVKKSVNVSITAPGEEIAQGVVITVNEAELNLNAQARTPIVIKASATNTNGDDLLYSFYVIEEDMTSSMQQPFSANQECIWVPRKAGTYQISVLVKNQVSFGKFDAIEQITVTVD